MSKTFTHSILLILILLPFQIIYGQNERVKQLYRDSIPDITYEIDSSEFNKKGKEKKIKRNVFYGFKTKKGFTRKGFRDKEEVELFYCLKKYHKPSIYIDKVWIWDIQKRVVIQVDGEELEKNPHYKILHGPYSKYLGGQKVEEGIFYIGSQHGRWMYYGKNFDLKDKVKYYKGFAKESKISYYDFERKKIKEVVPYRHEEKTGDYLFFFEDGQIRIRGEYDDGKQVGKWTEWYSNGKKLRIVQFPKDKFDETKPKILLEWNDKGQIVVKDGVRVSPNQNRNKRKSKKKR